MKWTIVYKYNIWHTLGRYNSQEEAEVVLKKLQDASPAFDKSYDYTVIPLNSES